MNEARHKCRDGFLSFRNSRNIWDVLSFVKEMQLRVIVSQLTEKDGTATKELSDIVDSFL